MPATATPFNVEESILGWQIETVRGTLPSVAAPWREFGRVLNGFRDLGPRNAVYKDAVLGAGQEAHEVGYEGIGYGGSIGFQVRDPLFLGFAWGKETARAALGGGFYRHTLVPTDKGLLPSFAVGMRDRRLDGSGAKQSIAYLATVAPRLSLRGEQPNPDGSGGRLMAAMDVLPHDHKTGADDANVDLITVTLQNLTPYRFSHATIKLGDAGTETQVFRVASWECSIDRRAQHAYYHQGGLSNKPFEAPPEGAMYPPFRGRFVADADTYNVSGSGRSLRQIVLDRVIPGSGIIQPIRTANQDEWQINFTDMAVELAEADRSPRGKILVDFVAHPRKSTFQYVDANNAAFFPT